LGRKFLTLDDLYDFYANNAKYSRHFNAKDDGSCVAVQVKGKMNFAEQNPNEEGLRRVHLQACHTEKNLNKSLIAEDVMNAALPSFANRPILARIHKVDDEYEFGGHDMHMEDGEVVYDEIPVGNVPSENNIKLAYDEEKDKTYVEVDGFLYETYSKAPQILERLGGEADVSVELDIRAMSFDAKEKVLVIEDFYFAGVTILGKTDDGDDINPGMAGSNIKLSDFQKNTVFTKELIEKLDALNEQLQVFNINNNSGKEEPPMTKFEELLAKYSKTAEDITFDYSEMSDEELEAKFEELFGESDPENEPEPVADPEANTEPEGTSEEPTENFKKVFELSQEDVRSALYTLLYAVEEEDNEWYGIVETYDDYFIYCGFFCGQYWKQGYEKNDNVVSFVGDRVHMNAILVTDEENTAIEEMRANYSSISEELKKYHEEPEKMQIFESDEWSGIAGTVDFAELQKRENHFDLSKDEITEKLNTMLLNAAKTGLNFAAVEKKISAKKLPIESKSNNRGKGRYGAMFVKSE
jgi:hypothetical protein